MKRARLALTALTVCLALSCARAQKAPAGSRTLFRHLNDDPTTLDPTTTNEELGMRVEDLIFRRLIGIDRDRRVVPSLALSWAGSSDGLVYDFRLDPKARWEDGSPVTSADVVFTIDRVRDPKVPAVNWRSAFEDLAAIETPDALTVVVRFKRPYAERRYAFNIPIVSAAAYGARPADVDRSPFGTGPYRLEKWAAHQALTLERRKDADASAYPFEKVVFRIIPNNAVSFQAGARGDLDEFYVTRDQVSAAQSSEAFRSRNRLIRVPRFLVSMIVWSFHNPVLADVRVRRALAMAWPRADAARRLYPPEGATLLSGPYPAGTPENAPDIQPPPYDPQASARLLDEAGLRMGTDGFRRRGGKRVSLELVYTTAFPMYRNLAEILSNAYAKVGVELVLRSYDWAAFNQRLAAGEFDVAPAGILFLPPNLDPYSAYHSSQAPPAGQNVGFYRNPEVDRVIEAARREMDDAKRLELYRQIHRLLAANPPADFLWGADQYWGISKRLEGVEVAPFGLFHFLPGSLAWRPVAFSR